MDKMSEPTLVELSVRVTGEPAPRALAFECDWDVGIGGSVWTSGELLAAHLELQQAQYRPLFEGKCVVELGSGTGFVGLAAAACLQPKHVFLTDLTTHLDCLERNVARNAAVIGPSVHVHVAELSWGDEQHEAALQRAIDAADARVDVIIGTDVAYQRELYAPLLRTLDRLARDHAALVLLGLNRADTGLAFFQQLARDGFEYYKVADEQLPEAYWGKDFALFHIRRRRADSDVPTKPLPA